MEEPKFQPTFIDNTQKKSPKRLIFLAAVTILVVALLFGIFKLMGSSGKNSESSEITPTPTEYQYPTDTPTPEISKAPKEEITSVPTSVPTTNPVDKVSGLDRSQLSIGVQNGSGIAGAAGKIADILKELGYDIDSTGNADNYDYTDVTIKVKSNLSKYLSLLKKDLSDYTVGTASADLDASSAADALIIIGK